jgi:hypothetical protein
MRAAGVATGIVFAVVGVACAGCSGEPPVAEVAGRAAASSDVQPTKETKTMALPTIGQPAPAFDTTDENGARVRLADFAGKSPVALVFFPKDDTPG